MAELGQGSESLVLLQLKRAFWSPFFKTRDWLGHCLWRSEETGDTLAAAAGEEGWPGCRVLSYLAG
jgi:hypothetical protein